jgi:hypothetical protein
MTLGLFFNNSINIEGGRITDKGGRGGVLDIFTL